jgi:hypothetical protein
MSEVKVLPRDVAAQDMARLVEGRADVVALERLLGLLDTSDPLQKLYYDALVLTGQRLSEHREALRDVVLINSQELSETGDASLKLAAATQAEAARYTHLRGAVQQSYLNPDPDLKLSAAELAQRSKTFERVFAIAPSVLSRLAAAEVVERGALVVEQLEQNPSLTDGASRERFKQVHQASEAALGVWTRERKEDLDATSGLNAQRASFDRQARGHELTVSAALWQIGRSGDIGQFIKRLEPGYASRRQAGDPIIAETDVLEGLEPVAS